MSRLTVRGRVTLAAVGILAVGLFAVSATFNLVLRDRLNADVSSVLRQRADAQLSTIDYQTGSISIEDATNDEALDAQSWVVVRNRFLERSPAPAELLNEVLMLGRVARPTQQTAGGSVRLLALPLREPRSGVKFGAVVVGVSLLPYQHSERIALLGTLLLCAVLVVAGTLAVRGVLSTALRPVADMASRAGEWGEHDMHRRFELGEPRDELTALAATFDALLDRIEGVLGREQRLSLELAHELRTPLSGIRAEAELALGTPLQAEVREGLTRVLAGTDRMAGVVDALLASARAELTHANSTCQPFVAMLEVIDAVRPLAQARGVSIEVAGSDGGAVVRAESELVARALQPLVDNAVRHAKSHVELTVTITESELRIGVSDDGPGLAQIGDIFAPGVSSSGGAGLGLPLARRMARSCGGDVIATALAVGARFDLVLPRQRIQVISR